LEQDPNASVEKAADPIHASELVKTRKIGTSVVLWIEEDVDRCDDPGER
jgi:hypothetical protein